MESETNPNPNFVDLGDNTALVCVDHQQYQKIVVPQLIDMTYKVHLGLFEEDVSLKLRTYNYDVVLIYENFKGSTLQTNPLLAEMSVLAAKLNVVLPVSFFERAGPAKIGQGFYLFAGLQL